MTEPRTGTLATPLIHQPSPIENPRNPGQHLTIAEAIIQAIRGGNTHQDAAAWAGVSPATLSQWITRGLTALTHHHENTPTPQEKQETTSQNPDNPQPNPQDPYAQLALDVARADAMARMKLVGYVHKAAETDWRAAVAALAAKERGSWAPPSRVEVTGAGGGPVGLGVAVLDHEGAVELAGRLEERRVLALGPGDSPE